jgi:hypothetical protein
MARQGDLASRASRHFLDGPQIAPQQPLSTVYLLSPDCYGNAFVAFSSSTPHFHINFQIE